MNIGKPISNQVMEQLWDERINVSIEIRYQVSIKVYRELSNKISIQVDDKVRT